MQNHLLPSLRQVVFVLVFCGLCVMLTPVCIREEPFRTNAHYLFSESFRLVVRVYAGTLAAITLADFFGRRGRGGRH